MNLQAIWSDKLKKRRKKCYKQKSRNRKDADKAKSREIISRQEERSLRVSWIKFNVLIPLPRVVFPPFLSLSHTLYTCDKERSHTKNTFRLRSFPSFVQSVPLLSSSSSCSPKLRLFRPDDDEPRHKLLPIATLYIIEYVLRSDLYIYSNNSYYIPPSHVSRGRHSKWPGGDNELIHIWIISLSFITITAPRF